MPSKHEPDPRFVDRLEWQLGSELRRQVRAGPRHWAGRRVMGTAALALSSVVLGAAGMGVSQQIGESWRKDLLVARLEVQMELAQQRLAVRRDAMAESRRQAEQGLRDERELQQQEMQIAQDEVDSTIMELDLEEIRRSGREPLGALSSPLVDGRDFVSERIRARMELAGRHLDLVRSERERALQRAAAGLVREGEVGQWNLAVREAELQLAGLSRQLELRRAYLDSELSAVEAEIGLLEVEADNRIALLSQQLQLARNELDRAQALGAAGVVGASETAQVQLHLAEVEGQLRLAESEREILQRELRRRAERSR